MPELPEIEVLRRQLEPFVGQRVRLASKTTTWPRVPNNLHQIEGHRLTGVHRHGKVLFLDFRGSDRRVLAFRFGMAGGFRIRSLVRTDVLPGPHEHLSLILKNAALAYFDVRRFGSVVWVQDHQALMTAIETGEPLPEFRMGPDLLGQQFDRPRGKAATAAWTTALERHPHWNMKRVLMDQTLLAGIGNIYASEILWAAEIHPAREAHSLDRDEVKAVSAHTRRILRAAVEAGGSTIQSFKSADGSRGSYRDGHVVYGREAEKCPRCTRRIVRDNSFDGRGTFFCRGCQK